MCTGLFFSVLICRFVLGAEVLVSIYHNAFLLLTSHELLSEVISSVVGYSLKRGHVLIYTRWLGDCFGTNFSFYIQSFQVKPRIPWILDAYRNQMKHHLPGLYNWTRKRMHKRVERNNIECTNLSGACRKWNDSVELLVRGRFIHKIT